MDSMYVRILGLIRRPKTWRLSFRLPFMLIGLAGGDLMDGVWGSSMKVCRTMNNAEGQNILRV